MVQWRTGKLRLLYAAPERVVLPGFLNYLSEALPAFIAVDEAHCISQWGHDFRPEYRQLRSLRERFPGLPVCALTATATEVVRRDIAGQLALREPAFFVGDFDRPNLHYRVERRVERQSQVREILEAHRGKSGIVYCISRKDTESLAAHLCEHGFRAAAYHAGLEHARRQEVQQAFSNEELDAVVATVAFGMGIDRSNVRFVVHAGLPASMEHYQQETGRAGRDGLPAECVLLFSYADKMKWQGIFDKDTETPEEIAAARRAKLNEIAGYAASHSCRHRLLVEYFGQAWRKGKCCNCDNCSDAAPVRAHPESDIIAKKILSCVVRLQERYGVGYVIKVLRGVTADVQPVHCGLSTFGLMEDSPQGRLRQWIDELIGLELLARTDGDYPVLRLTAAGWEVLRGGRAVSLSVLEPQAGDGPRKRRKERVAERKARADAGLSDSDLVLFEALRQMRMKLARERGCPAYIIMPDTTLTNIARARPHSVEELAEIHGIGDAKLDAYGADILRTVRETAEG
jgi:ATP-dependent DNA helicase RecQ